MLGPPPEPLSLLQRFLQHNPMGDEFPPEAVDPQGWGWVGGTRMKVRIRVRIRVWIRAGISNGITTGCHSTIIPLSPHPPSPRPHPFALSAGTLRHPQAPGTALGPSPPAAPPKPSPGDRGTHLAGGHGAVGLALALAASEAEAGPGPLSGSLGVWPRRRLRKREKK